MSSRHTGSRGVQPTPVAISTQRSDDTSPSGPTGFVGSRAELRASFQLTDKGLQDTRVELSVKFGADSSSWCPGKSQERTNAICRGIEERLKDNLIPWRRAETSEEEPVPWGQVAEKARDWLVATPASEARLKFGNFDWSTWVEVIDWDVTRSVIGRASC